MSNEHLGKMGIQFLFNPAIIWCVLGEKKKKTEKIKVTGLPKVKNDQSCKESRVWDHDSPLSSPERSPVAMVLLQLSQNHQPK